ncbi:MAG: TRAP transporter substrate-binding protein [Gemmatimonadetes bacterium]|nr:TRAP transporter substrate-binding protein [Gemmatimonadota bacterium]MCY3676417.1 TRAP transporter substrate-binding protein [Gemmatimonadota bacterium]MYA43886.1 TRAP transporter substrate-binding protein [Gemmatimonadota bacterium]MYE94308.1 TRAP transporter substrate-binding protein [Gemmatimonadota bacterium]MYJ10015.1 TRAP transporter substrate-binding protein [Gemmatimonadota bacterium]
MGKRRPTLALAAATALTAGCTPASETRELSLAHFLPADHVLTEGMFTPLSEKLEGLSGGRLTVRQFPAGALNSSAPAQYSILLGGVADIALVIPAYTADVFPKTDLIAYPGVCKTAMECTEGLRRAWSVLEPEYEAKVLGLWANDAPLLLTRDKPVRTLEDMRGLKIRVSTRSAIPFIEALGASAVMQPGTVVHQSLSTGVIDGVAMSPSGIVAFQLHEPTGYLTTWLPLSGLPFVLLMNQGVYDALSPDEQGWIDEAADAAMSLAGAASYARAGAEGLQMARDAGVEFIDLPESEKRRFEEAIASVREAGLARQVDDMTAGEIIRLFDPPR